MKQELPRPLALCLESIDAAREDQRYLQCVALAGGLPGLTLDAQGVASWQDGASAACELWISADDQLMALRPSGGAAVRLERAGRSLDLPEEKPVELIDQDELVLGERRLLLHVHGKTEHVAGPSFLVPLPEAPRSRAMATAAALAFGAAVGLGGVTSAEAGKTRPDKAKKKPPIRVRPAPPKPMPPPRPQPPVPKPTPPKKKKPKKKKPAKPGASKKQDDRSGDR